jgi:hypothetical protein
MQSGIKINGHPKSIDCLTIKKSAVGSLGVFTKSDLPEFICVDIAKAIIFPREIYIHAIYACQVAGLPDDKLTLDQYVLGWNENFICLPLGNIGMYNHSDTPNCEYIQMKETGSIGIVTLKTIKAGEELTVSYGSEWFKKKTYINKVAI